MRSRQVTTAASALVLLSLALGGCATSTGIPTAQGPTAMPFALTIDDRSSWGTLQIYIGDTAIGHADCEESVTVAPGNPGVPPLPWTVRLATAADETVDQRIEDGLAGPKWLLVFDAQWMRAARRR